MKRFFYFMLLILGFGMSGGVFAQEKKASPLNIRKMAMQNMGKRPNTNTTKKKAQVLGYIPGGYSQVGNTNLYTADWGSAIDIYGNFEGLYYGSTYSDAGYKSAIKVKVGNQGANDISGSYTGYPYVKYETYLEDEDVPEYVYGYNTEVYLELEPGENNTVKFKNLYGTGFDFVGNVDYEAKTITIPSQTISDEFYKVSVCPSTKVLGNSYLWQGELTAQELDASVMRFSDWEGMNFPYIPDEVYAKKPTLIIDVSEASEGCTARVMNGWWSSYYADNIPLTSGMKWEVPITDQIVAECAQSGEAKDLTLMITNGSATITSVYFEDYFDTGSKTPVEGDIVCTFDDNNVYMPSFVLISEYGNSEVYVFSQHTYSKPKDDATWADNGNTYDGVKFESYVEQQGEMARISYKLTNTNDAAATVSLGTYADVMIGWNDAAPIARKISSAGQPYGVSMKDGQGAELCVLFGDGLAGVSAVDDYWFGYWSANSAPENIVGNYYQSSYWMEENGNYDSGMGWCWKDKTLAPGETRIFSYLIAVGDINLEPNSSFAATPEDPDLWNDLSLLHKITINGTYESPAGIDGRIEYAVEDSEEWQSLTGLIHSGSEFSAPVYAMFDASKPVHKIRFRTVDAVGNTTLLAPITYQDVSFHDATGIEDLYYNYGTPVVQTNVTTDLGDGNYVVNDYQNNVNAGTASFKVQGVFPVTIGRRTYTFEVLPRPLEGSISLDSEGPWVYSPYVWHVPSWKFNEPNNLVEDVDYYVDYDKNYYPGEASVNVVGEGNFSGVLSAQFTIDKATLIANNNYSYILPDEDCDNDGTQHAAEFYAYSEEGMGTPVFTYVNTADNTSSTEAPSADGDYDVYLEIPEGRCYYGVDKTKIGSFSITTFDDAEWAALVSLNNSFAAKEWNVEWDMTAGKKNVKNLSGVQTYRGHVVGLDFSGKHLTGEVTEDFTKFPELTSLDLSNNDLSGNVGSILADYSKLEFLHVSYNHFTEVSPMIPASVNLWYGYQSFQEPIDFHVSNQGENLRNALPPIVFYNHIDQTFNTDFGAHLYDADGSTYSLWNSYGWDVYYYMYGNPYKGQSGDIIDMWEWYNGFDIPVRLYFEQGDVNFSGTTDAADVQRTINYIFGDYSDALFCYTAADTYTDETINVQDVVCLVNILLADNDVQKSSKKKAPAFEDAAADAYIYINDNGEIILQAEKEIATLDILAKGNVKWSDATGMTTATNGGHLVAYSLMGNTFPVGTTVLGKCTAGSHVVKASAADIKAQSVNVKFDGSASANAIIGINADGNEQQIYDAAGRQHNTPIKGLNIKRNGKKFVNK